MALKPVNAHLMIDAELADRLEHLAKIVQSSLSTNEARYTARVICNEAARRIRSRRFRQNLSTDAKSFVSESIDG